LPSLAYPSEARMYFTTILPKFARSYTGPAIFGHSLSSAVGYVYPNYALLLIGALLTIWCWAARRAFARGDAAFAFAGALAVSTYAQKTSWDYNLVTTYPLFALLFLKAYRESRFTLLVFGLFAIAGDRRLFVGQGPAIFTAEVHVAFQVAFLAMAAVAVARDGDETAEAPAATEKAERATMLPVCAGEAEGTTKLPAVAGAAKPDGALDSGKPTASVS
ncbi:MAG: hypothetical protein M3O50_14145, partial [Myxococcota bacterium]|nr:hypothetical protein [Myxococcota bacterium]